MTPEDEAHRHACEVRYVARLSRDERRAYLEGVERKRGERPALRLWQDVQALLPRGRSSTR